MEIRGYKKAKRDKRTRLKKSKVISYARVTSESQDGMSYLVVRYRSGRVGCTCPSKMWRPRNRCKHIVRFIDFEKTERGG